MLHESVADDLRADEFAPGFIRPAWEGYCFANVPDTILRLFGEREVPRSLPADVFDGIDVAVDNVIVVLIDGFGYSGWKREHEQHGLLRDLTERGTVTPLTSIYPSETAAAITTLQTGRQPIEHGLLGWFQYHEDLDDLVQTLPFSTLDGTPLREAVVDADPSWLFDGVPSTVYERAADAGITPIAVVPEGIPDGAHSTLALRGAETSGYATVAEMALRLRQRVETTTDPTYVYGYVPNVDTAAHEYGTETEEYRSQVAMIATCMRRELIENLDPATAERTLLVVTADHGHVDTVPRENVALDSLDGVSEHLRSGPSGDPLPVMGSPRNLQFRVQEGHIKALRESLESQLDCLTFTRTEAADADLFGDRPATERFESREPDLVMTHRNRGVWYDDDLNELDLIGMHGGLHPDEMLVPFAAARIDALQ